MRQHPLNLTDREPETRSNSVQVSISDPNIRMIFGLFGDNLTDEPLSREIVFGIPAVKAAVNRISDTIASLPLHYYYDDAVKGRQKATSDPVSALLKGNVNEAFLTSNRWRKRLTMDLLLEGRHVTLIRRNKAGRVHSLWPLDNDKLTIRTVDGIPYYDYQVPGKARETYLAANVLDFVWMPRAGCGHVNPIDSNRDAFGLCRAIERYASRMFRNGGVPAYIITYNGPPMSAAVADQTRQAVKQALAEAAENGGAPVLPVGFDIKVLGYNPTEAQLLEVKRFQVEEIARIFGIPRLYLQDLADGTLSNVENQDIFYARHTLAPFLELIEGELNSKLAPKSSSFAEFSLEGLLRGDSLGRANAFRTLINAGVMTIDEARALDNLPAFGGNAARLLIQGAMVPLDDAGKHLSPGNPPPQDDGTEDHIGDA